MIIKSVKLKNKEIKPVHTTRRTERLKSLARQRQRHRKGGKCSLNIFTELDLKKTLGDKLGYPLSRLPASYLVPHDQSFGNIYFR